MTVVETKHVNINFGIKKDGDEQFGSIIRLQHSVEHQPNHSFALTQFKLNKSSNKLPTKITINDNLLPPCCFEIVHVIDGRLLLTWCQRPHTFIN